MFWKILKRYWYLPFLAVGGVLAYALFCWWRPGSKLTPLSTIWKELEVIRAGAEADRVRSEMNTEEAVKHVKEKYADQRARLTEDQKKRAEILENDPEALARYIVRGTL